MSNNQGYSPEERIAELVIEELNKTIDSFPPKAVCYIALQEYLNMSTDLEVLNYLNAELQKSNKTVLLIALEAAFGQEVSADKLEQALSIAKETQAKESQGTPGSAQEKFEALGTDALVKISRDSATIYNKIITELCNKYKDPTTNEPQRIRISLAMLGEELTNYPVETKQELTLLYDKVSKTSSVNTTAASSDYIPYDEPSADAQAAEPSGPLSLDDVAKYAKQMHQKNVANKFAIHAEVDTILSFNKLIELSASQKVSINQLPTNFVQNLQGDNFNRTIITLANLFQISPEKIVTLMEKVNKRLSKQVLANKNERANIKPETQHSSDTLAQCPNAYAMLTHLQNNGFPSANLMLDFLLPEYRARDGHSLRDLEDALDEDGDIQAVCYTITKGLANTDEKRLMATAPKIAVELVKENGVDIVEELLLDLAYAFVNNKPETSSAG